MRRVETQVGVEAKQRGISGVIKSAGLSRQPSGRRKLLPILIPVPIGTYHP